MLVGSKSVTYALPNENGGWVEAEGDGVEDEDGDAVADAVVDADRVGVHVGGGVLLGELVWDGEELGGGPPPRPTCT